MANTVKINISTIVQRKILHHISSLKLWTGVHGGMVKGQNVNEKFERKINAGFEFNVFELDEKHFCPNF